LEEAYLLLLQDASAALSVLKLARHHANSSTPTNTPKQEEVALAERAISAMFPVGSPIPLINTSHFATADELAPSSPPPSASTLTSISNAGDGGAAVHTPDMIISPPITRKQPFLPTIDDDLLNVTQDEMPSSSAEQSTEKQSFVLHADEDEKKTDNNETMTRCANESELMEAVECDKQVVR
jgi:hypothetical protein